MAAEEPGATDAEEDAATAPPDEVAPEGAEAEAPAAGDAEAEGPAPAAAEDFDPSELAVGPQTPELQQLDKLIHEALEALLIKAKELGITKPPYGRGPSRAEAASSQPPA